MNITIGAYDETSRTVSVLFEHGGVAHTRTVNACHDESGAYDADATEARIGEVARGVEVKIDMGVIADVPEASAPGAAPAPVG